MPKINPGNRTERRGHRPPHVPTDAGRKQVEALASFGVPQEHIAKVIGVGERTLRKYYADVLATAEIKANSLVAQSLFNKATKGEGSASERRETLTVAAVVDCRGLSMKACGTRNPLVTDLLAKGQARLDSFGLGIDVDLDCALVDADGKTSSHVFAIGPLTRGAFWESIAVPDIALQCQALAQRLSREEAPLAFPADRKRALSAYRA